MKKYLQEAIYLLYEKDAKLQFGKYLPSTIEEIYLKDSNYLNWCIINIHNFVLSQECFNYLSSLSHGTFYKVAIEKNLTKLYEISLILKRISSSMAKDGIVDSSDWPSNIYKLNDGFKSIELTTDYLKEIDKLITENLHHTAEATYISGYVFSEHYKEEKKAKFDIEIVDYNDIDTFLKYQKKHLLSSNFIIHKIIEEHPLFLFVTIDYSDFEYSDFYPYSGYGYETYVPPFSSSNVSLIINKELNNLNELLLTYSKSRKLFPNLNLYNASISIKEENRYSFLSPYSLTESLSFSIDLDQLSKYVSDWCGDNNLMHKFNRITNDRISSYLKYVDRNTPNDYEEKSNADYEREAFDALTDGQYGDFNDFDGDVDDWIGR